MKHHTAKIELATTGHLQFIDITDRVRRVVEESGVKNGVAHVFTKHTTTAVKINERCEKLQKDMREFLDAAAPRDKRYHHNHVAVDGRDNAHSHLRSLLLGSSESIPVIEGRLGIGAWQSIFFIELDGPRDSRNIVISVMGE